MKFNIWGIVLMIVAIIAAQFIGEFLIPYLGSSGGGLIGSFLIGAIAYAVYTLLSGGKFRLMSMIVFAVLVYVSNLIAGYVGGMLGLSAGYISLALAGVVMSFLWGWVGARFGGKKIR